MAPLSLKLNDADLSAPCLMEGKYPVVIKTAEIVPSKSGKGSFLHVQCGTTEEAQSDKGKTLNPGFPIGTRLMLPIPGTEFGDGPNADGFTRNLGMFMFAVANLKPTETNKSQLPEFNEEYVTNLPGLVIGASVKNETTEEYGKQSTIKSFYAIG